MEKKIISIGGLLGITAIILGAFGAHALKKILSIDQLAAFETGVKYQMYHALFLLFLGTNQGLTDKAKKPILILTTIGVILFSGSIYLLTTMDITEINFKAIGFITPIGGLLLILAWGILMVQFLNKKR
jgi:uncharacterized membrane protein YgdD (TMEM256/DUF423 family)